MIPDHQKWRSYWDWFADRLSKTSAYEEVLDLLHGGHPNRIIPNRLFSNLSVFVHTLSITEDATGEEVELYLELVHRWQRHSADLFPPGALESAEKHLTRALADLG